MTRTRFNGATLLQAWRVRVAGAVSSPQVQLQWGHASSSVESPHPAATVSSGITLQWGHASSSVESRPCIGDEASQVASFNGATLLQAWRADMLVLAPLVGSRLQWGHASSSVERPGRW